MLVGTTHTHAVNSLFLGTTPSKNLMSKDVKPNEVGSKDVNTRDAFILSGARDAAEASKYNEQSVRKLLSDYATAMSAFQSGEPGTATDLNHRKEVTRLYALIVKLHRHKQVLQPGARQLLDIFFFASGSGVIMAGQAFQGKC